MKIPDILVLAVNETAEHPTAKCGALPPEQCGGSQIRLRNSAFFIDGELGRRRKIVQMHKAVSGFFKLGLYASQLIVLHFELDLVNAQLVDQAGTELAVKRASSGILYARGGVATHFNQVPQRNRGFMHVGTCIFF